ncbi:uncharacterized protein LOC124703819 isoform X2 [Lolium rigidum]|uniref:uncharacterized protein LOC124703819 isoform X2 n=1 Tax=Lolium rigidum TaxID=89674 RepID=UPI001F5D56BA|nr:uncharacterized protein LOC124703819 isoform X2 [Lolium rigidum]XP_047092013.1 uncharacterized protein LOC124703819 isoform X2 [Lolium rigidum]XP_047092015.1 uncharacterized protein LOC124703819 isoform X2 [Lolium rigidum]XP_047092016.1 uncharacterized protein LOC124703819 isoform X2 [Lolium rigidum]
MVLQISTARGDVCPQPELGIHVGDLTVSSPSPAFGHVCWTTLPAGHKGREGNGVEWAIPRVQRCFELGLSDHQLLKFSYAYVIMVQFHAPIMETSTKSFSPFGTEVFLLDMKLASESVPMDLGAPDLIYRVRIQVERRFNKLNWKLGIWSLVRFINQFQAIHLLFGGIISCFLQ